MPKKPKNEDLMTVGELKERLEGYSDDTKIFFGCNSLTFYRLKLRGEKFLQMEFTQTVYDDKEGNVYVENH
ncbi:MAG: hypothetical protein D3923_13390 [Candidatus Electrothrix sp. AR3]|nr:hypothetical protein [Candidatus Electrothrix sp. AR3]